MANGLIRAGVFGDQRVGQLNKGKVWVKDVLAACLMLVNIERSFSSWHKYEPRHFKLLHTCKYINNYVIIIIHKCI